MSDHYWKVTLEDSEETFYLSCPQCGEETEAFIEGYCPHCHDERQRRLNLHNAQYDYWQGLSDKEREDQIRWSSNHYG